MSKNYFPLFAETTIPAKSAAAEIRSKIGTALCEDTLCTHIIELLSPDGLSGNKYFDHCRAAMAIENSAHLTTEYSNLTIYNIWEHLIIVLRKRGYIFESGRLINFRALEDNSTDIDDDAIAPTFDESFTV